MLVSPEISDPKTAWGFMPPIMILKAFVEFDFLSLPSLFVLGFTRTRPCSFLPEQQKHLPPGFSPIA